MSEPPTKREKLSANGREAGVTPRLSKNQGSFGIPPGGGNPIFEVSRMAPQLGKYGAGPPTTIPKLSPPWYKGSGITNNRLGSIAPLVSSPGPMEGVDFGQGNIVTDTIGFQTNYTIPSHKITRVYKNPMFDNKQVDMVVIIQKNTKHPISERNSKESHRYVVLNLPGWNYMQGKLQKLPLVWDSVKTAEEVWEKWAVEGIVRTEEGQDEAPHHDQVGRERMVNATMWGYAYTYNIWGNNVRPGTTLWLILKQIETSGYYSLNTYAKDVQNLDLKGNPELTDKPFQLIPWAHYNYTRPPLDVLMYYDEFNRRQIGKAIYIGRSETGTMGSGQEKTNEIMTSLKSMLELKKMFVYVNPAYKIFFFRREQLLVF